MTAPSARTGLVIITHGQIGQALIDVAEFILDQSLDEVGFLSFSQSAACAASGDPTSDDDILHVIEAADRGQGVLVMTDICGASPYNHVARLLRAGSVVLTSGINLAMLIRAWNYRDRLPPQLVELVIEGGLRDIRECHQ